ncbi:Ctf8p and Ctf18p associating protein [Rhodosporidiobolus nylandii]
MAERLIVFADKSSDPPLASQPSYQLLALPPALLAHLSSTPSSSDDDLLAQLEIRGDSSDSAVLVTPDQTYALRGVQNSNSLCVCAAGGRGREGWFVQSGEGARDDEGEGAEGEGPARKKQKLDGPANIEIEAVLHETLEAVPGVARTEKLDGLLKGCEYTGEAAEEELVQAGQPNPRQKHTFDTLRSRLPASDGEIRIALSKKRVLTLSTFLRPVSTSFLLSILPSVLSTLPLPAEVAHPAPLGGTTAAKKGKPAKGKEATKPPPAGADAPLWTEANEADLLDALDAVDCGTDEAGPQVLAWFGEKVEGAYRKRWRIDGRKVVREVGVVLLAEGGGIHLHRPPPLSTLQYLPPSSLSPDPPARFAELFALKPRWLEQDMGLFIDDLTGGDKKKRDALVLKFVRKVKEGTVTWWTPRNLWT